MTSVGLLDTGDHILADKLKLCWAHQDNHLASIISVPFVTIVNFSYYLHENTCILVAY